MEKWDFRIQTESPGDTQKVGEIIGGIAQPGDIYLLTGPLGAGKTCLSQGIARGLGVPENLRSPTFVLMTKHQGRLVLHHLDLYRINDPWEAWDLGLDEQLLGEGVCVVEWADKAEEIFPPGSCWIELDYGPGDDCRILEITVDSGSTAPSRYELLIKELKMAFDRDGKAKGSVKGRGDE